RTGRLKPRQLLDLHEAHTARANRFQARLVAKNRNLDPRQLRGLDDEHPPWRLDGLTVNGETDAVDCVHHHAGYGQPCSAMWRSYSARYWFTVATTGLVAKSPSAQRTLPLISPDSDFSRSRSFETPRPCSMRARIPASQAVPSRHGVHLPHDSWRKNSSISA